MGKFGSIKLVQLHHFIEVHVPSQESECFFCVRCIDFASYYEYTTGIGFRNVPTV
jgi:hypothetical protein